MAKNAGFQKRSKASEEIPSSSLADIAFLLLIFFMVSTVFPTDRERPIDWPEAAAAQKIDEKKKNILNVWLQEDGAVFINDQQYQMTEVSQVVAPLYAASERALVISIRGDRDTPYVLVDQLQKEMVAAGVVRVVFAAQLEQRMQRERR
ncbi:MAG: biopolymer transporter ExbD [Gemmatimonadota bacterium]